MSSLRDISLVETSVPASATFREAATVLRERRIGAIAVLDGGEIVGVFTDVDLLRAIFPAYLDDLHNTAFVPDDVEALVARASAVSGEPVTAHMRQAESLELDTSMTHAAERFLHSEEEAIPVLDDGRYVGMLPRGEFALAMLRRLTDR